MLPKVALTKFPTSKPRHSVPGIGRRQPKGGSIWSTLGSYALKGLSGLGRYALKGLSSLWEAGKSALKTAAPGIISSVAEGATKYLTEPSQAEKDAMRAEEARIRAEEARREQDLQLELEERRESAEAKRAEERERAMAAKRAQLAPSEQSIGQFREQAARFISQLKARYPATFSQYPQYGPQLEQKILGAFMSPEDPSDPLAAQKVLGDIEYQIAAIEGRINPTGPARVEYGAPEIESLRGPRSYRTSSAFGKSGARRDIRRGRGGGISGVLRA